MADDRAVEEKIKKLFAPPASTDNFAVEVLTLHKAKGLEWDIVLLPGLHRLYATMLLGWRSGWNGYRDARTSRAPEIVRRVFLAPVKHVAEEKEAVSEWIRAASGERDREELKRLLYVGCTRARLEVHLFAQCRELKGGDLGKAHAQTLLHTAWPVAADVFVQHADRQLHGDSDAGKIVETPFPSPFSSERRAGELPGQLESVAASGGGDSPNPMIRLKNFQRLRDDWQQPPTLTDVPMSRRFTWQADIGEDEGEEDLPAFSRPKGSWRARAFGIVLHAFLEPLARILMQHTEPQAVTQAIDHMAEPIRLQLLRAGHSPMEAGREATRMLGALHSVARDENGRWILAAHSNPVTAAGVFSEGDSRFR